MPTRPLRSGSGDSRQRFDDAETWFVIAIADFPFIATPAKGGSSRGGATMVTVQHRSNSSKAAVHTVFPSTLQRQCASIGGCRREI